MNRLKMMRKSLNKSLEEISKATGIPKSSLSEYETKGRTPRTNDIWQTLADYYGTSVAYLMGLSEVEGTGVGNKIKSIRQNLGLSMEQFGQLVEPIASDSLVSRWERGVNSPNNSRLKKIAELGNITVEELLSSNLKTITQSEYQELLVYKEKYLAIKKLVDADG